LDGVELNSKAVGENIDCDQFIVISMLE